MEEAFIYSNQYFTLEDFIFCTVIVGGATPLHLKNYLGYIKEDFLLKIFHIVQQENVGLSPTTLAKWEGYSPPDSPVMPPLSFHIEWVRDRAQ